MCRSRVVLSYYCEHYFLHTQQCPQSVSSGLDCSPLVIYRIKTISGVCRHCLDVEFHEYQVRRRENGRRFFQSSLDNILRLPLNHIRREAAFISLRESLIAKMIYWRDRSEAQLEAYRIQEQQSPKPRLSDLNGNAVMLAAFEFKMLEMQSFLTANNNHITYMLNDDD